MLQKRMWKVYYRLAGDTETSKRYKVLHPIPFRWLQAGYIICFGFLLLSMMLAVLFVVVSVAVVGFSYGFSEACYTASDPLDGKYASGMQLNYRSTLKQYWTLQEFALT